MDPVGEEPRALGHVGADLDDGLAAKGLAAGFREGGIEGHELAAAEDVPLPAYGDDGVAVVEEEAIAGVDVAGAWGRRRGAVEGADHAPAAAVDDVHDEPPVALPGVPGSDEGEVRAEAHAALGVAGGKVQVDDGPVGIVGGVHGEVKEAVDALIGAGVAEGPAGGIGLVTGYIEVDDGHGRLPRPLGRSEGWLGYETA